MSAAAAATAPASSLIQAPPGVRVIRWGFLGCGKISHDFVNAIKHLSDVELVACAARSTADAASFATLFGIKKSYGSYAELVADPEIDVIYVGTLHVSHAEHASLCLNAGKHVLVEKPFAVTAADAEAVFELAMKKNLFVMEALWSRFTPAHVRMRELLAEGPSGTLGVPMAVQGSFGVHMPLDVPRLWTNALAGGALLDLAVYLVSLSANVFSKGGTEAPSRVVAVGDLSIGEQIDVHETISLQYGAGRMASLTSSMLCDMANEATIYCSKGWVKLHAPFWCTQTISYKLHGKGDGDDAVTTLHFPQPRDEKSQVPFVFQDSQLMVWEALEVNNCLRAGKLQSDIHSHKDTLHIASILDECRRQMGVVYAEDRRQQQHQQQQQQA